MNLTILSDYGINYKSGIARCMDDAEFYEKLLGMFVSDDSFERAEKAFLAKDYSQLFSCLHELKGACGNADITDLYDAVCPLVELLRAGSQDDAKVALMFGIAKNAYEKAIKGIKLAIDS